MQTHKKPKPKKEKSKKFTKKELKAAKKEQRFRDKKELMSLRVKACKALKKFYGLKLKPSARIEIISDCLKRVGCDKKEYELLHVIAEQRRDNTYNEHKLQYRKKPKV